MRRQIKLLAALAGISIILCLSGTVVTFAENRQSIRESGNGEEEMNDSDNSDSQNSSGNPDNPDDPDSPADPEPEKELIPYKLTCPEPNGRYGYYIKKPEIEILHPGEVGATCYQLYLGEKILKEGKLKEPGESEILRQNSFGEGKCILKVWMEDREGNLAEESYQEIPFTVDTKAPETVMKAAAGFDVWYQDSVPIEVDAKDKGSGVEQVICTVNGEQIGKSENAHSKFIVTQSSTNGSTLHVVITVRDRAGNQSTEGKSIYIDRKNPDVTISGAEDYTISSRPVLLNFLAEDDNVILERKTIIQWESPSGKQKETEETQASSTTLEKDGIYKIYSEASDYSGRSTKKNLQVIIDKKNPIIRHVDEVDNQYMKEFCWNYLQDEIIQDFTTYTYEIRLDQNWYPLGKKVDKEGGHQLEISVRDAAGNQSKASARFVLDHTPPDILLRGIEDGEKYEEKVRIKISVPQKTDRLQKIFVNGEEIKLESLNQCALLLEECQDYEVCVWAKDLAGNEAKKTVMFQIVPKKTWMDRMKFPMEEYLPDKGRQENRSKQEREREDLEDKGISVCVFAIVIVAIVSVAAGTGMTIAHKTQNKKKFS